MSRGTQTPAHVLIRHERVRAEPAKEAHGERELSPGSQVLVMKFENVWALIARDGLLIGYVLEDALAKLQ